MRGGSVQREKGTNICHHQMQIVLYNIYVYLNSFLPLLFFFCFANSFISLRIRISGECTSCSALSYYMDRLFFSLLFRRFDILLRFSFSVTALRVILLSLNTLKKYIKYLLCLFVFCFSSIFFKYRI